MTTLAFSVLVGSFFLAGKRTTIKSGMGSKLAVSDEGLMS